MDPHSLPGGRTVEYVIIGEGFGGKARFHAALAVGPGTTKRLEAYLSLRTEEVITFEQGGVTFGACGPLLATRLLNGYRPAHWRRTLPIPSPE